jgi:Arylsulfotransferase (ASST)
MLDVCCSRRGLIRGTLATAATAAIAWPAGTAEAEAAERTAPTLGYMSRPDLKPPRIKMSHRQPLPASPQYFLITADGPVGHKGPLILDQNGDVIWFSPVPPAGEATNFNAQTYRGAPVLTWWERTRPSNDPTFGVGVGYIANQQYKVIAKVSAGNGLTTDFHELNLTSHGTALITARRSHQVNLSKLGGPAKGYVWSGVAQEINVATGKVVFEWDSMNHVPVTETLRGFTGGGQVNPFDYFHINSVAVAHDGDLLISARDTCAVYKVSRSTGAVKWQLGGKKSNFRMGQGATFWWQHDVREAAPNVLSIFDDASKPSKESQSRGILLNLDTAKMRATLRRAYTSPARPRAANQGSMQLLSDGRVLVGWGNVPTFTEFAADGAVLLNGSLPRGDWSYRAYTADWTGSPGDRPAAAARRDRSGGTVVYMSWNGATEVASWTVHAGSRESALTPSGVAPRTTFETAIFTAHNGPYFSVDAVDANGRVLGRSSVVKC